MHKKILSIGITILFLGVTAAPLTQSIVIKESNTPISNGNILYVGGSGEGNYTKIQDAINDSFDGDTVFVYAYSSPYYERLRVNKSINLIGEDKETTVIDGSRKRNGVLIYDADEVYISGFTIQNCDSEIWSYIYGIHIWSDFNTITGNIITKNKVGIFIDYSEGNIITDNIISYNGGGVSLDDSEGNIITGNNISYNEGGVGTQDSFSNIINKNNFFYNTKHGSFNDDFFGLDQIPNIWYRNYWNRTRILPKPIFGFIYFVFIKIPILIPWVKFDWRPALKPYDIGV